MDSESQDDTGEHAGCKVLQSNSSLTAVLMIRKCMVRKFQFLVISLARAPLTAQGASGESVNAAIAGSDNCEEDYWLSGDLLQHKIVKYDHHFTLTLTP
ncbi:hypothetical protein WISP_22470 [Willisornis vidua]|uniref:Uncharacterized protein n=1 Tax=Willisornis vidua TaxID=1566151 RepID=A0ABQ9DU84_9PASS|nr:hypothetical protein WISP_22470 [Willisornis vidua]